MPFKLRPTFLIVALVLIVQAIASETTSVKSNMIVGGSTISIEKVPYQVSLRYVGIDGIGAEHRCGGSIISDKFIVTAAHCVDPKRPEIFEILAGTSYHNKYGQKFPIKRIAVPNEFILGILDNDIAIIELATRLTFGASIRPIALPSANETISDGTMCTISGWGTTKRIIIINRTKLRATQVPIVNQIYCNHLYKGRISPQMMCAGFDEGGRDSCRGDSGGALNCPGVNGPTLFGVISWGNDCALPDYPGVYTRVTAYRTWIHDTIKKLST